MILASQSDIKDIITTIASDNSSLKTGLQAIQEILENIRADLYENRRRLVKLGAQGEMLAESATEWTAIQDNASGLVWEHKSQTGSHSQSLSIRWSEVANYVNMLNNEKYGGLQSWRLPTQEELKTIITVLKNLDKFGYSSS